MTFLEELQKAKSKILSTESTIQLVSHYDADGVSAAAIMIKTLEKLGKKYELTIVNKIRPETIEILRSKKPELIIFTDIGSSYISEIKTLTNSIIILDHHDITENLENIIHINPAIFSMDELSGSCVTLLLAREMVNDDELAPLALIGAIGDMTLNNVSFFKNNPNIKLERGLKVFGRFTRPLHEALTRSEVILNIDSEASAIQFLSDLEINPKKKDSWKTLSDLTDDEKQKLNDALIKENSEDIFSDVWTLIGFKDELRDGKEFATIINACSRMGRSDVAIDICLKKEGSLDEARKLVIAYRRMLSRYFQWIRDKGSTLERDKVTFILGKDYIHENMIGTIASILSRTAEKPIIAMTNSEDGVKVSARALGGMNINKVVSEAAKSVGGTSGGHCEAAGATIPRGKEEEFMAQCESIINMRNTLIEQ